MITGEKKKEEGGHVGLEDICRWGECRGRDNKNDVMFGSTAKAPSPGAVFLERSLPWPYGAKVP